MSEDSRYVYMPRGQSIAEPGVIPAGPLLFTDALRDSRRWSAYYGQPRGTIAPSIIGFRGLGDPVPVAVRLRSSGISAFERNVVGPASNSAWTHLGRWVVMRQNYPDPYSGSPAEYRTRVTGRHMPYRTDFMFFPEDISAVVRNQEWQGRDNRSAPWRVIATRETRNGVVLANWGADAILNDLYRVSRIGRHDTETASWTRERAAAGLGAIDDQAFLRRQGYLRRATRRRFDARRRQYIAIRNTFMRPSGDSFESVPVAVGSRVVGYESGDLVFIKTVNGDSAYREWIMARSALIQGGASYEEPYTGPYTVVSGPGGGGRPAGLGHCGPLGCPCTGLGACCSACARGKACKGSGGMSGWYSSIQTPTDGYAVPVLVGAGIGYLTEKKTGALVGAALGAFFRWVWGKAEPTVMPIVEAVSPSPVSGFTDDFRWDPTMVDSDSSLNRAQFRTLQAILVIGAAALALKVGKTVGRKNNSGRRRNRRGAR